MVRFNVKLGGFSTVIGAALGIFLYNHSSLIIPEQVSKGNGNIINFDKQFDSDSVSPSLKMLEKMNNTKGERERILIKITSPGGAVFEGKKLKVAMHTGLPVDTYISAFGASMAADTWTQGERRYVEPDALVLFHGAYSGDYSSSQLVLTKKLDILTSQNFMTTIEAVKDESSDTKPSTADLIFPNLPTEETITPKAMKNINAKDFALYRDLIQQVKLRGYDTVLMELRSSLDIVSVINSSMLDSMTTIVKQSNGKLTIEILRKILFDNFSRDVVLTGKQLFDIGVATHLGAPNEEDYASE